MRASTDSSSFIVALIIHVVLDSRMCVDCSIYILYLSLKNTLILDDRSSSEQAFWLFTQQQSILLHLMV